MSDEANLAAPEAHAMPQHRAGDLTAGMAGESVGERKANRNLSGLMGLRGVAALMIVLFHLAPNVSVPSAFSFIKTHFGMGVPLFFVLSGFSLMYSTRPYVGQEGWIQTYVIKRYFRIAPLFYVMIVFFTIYNMVVWNLMPTASPLIINLLFLHNFIPGYHESIVWAGWTLGVEMIFYALFPIVIVVVTSFQRSLVLVGAGILVSYAARDLLALKGQGAYASMSFAGNLFYFAAGIAAFFLYKCLSKGAWNRMYVGPGCAVLLGGAAWTMVYLPVGRMLPTGTRIDIFVWASIFALMAVWQSLYPSRLLASRAMQFCGERSYSIYLVHAIFVFGLKRIYTVIYAALGNEYVAFLMCAGLGVAVVLGVASLAYDWVEQPGIRFGADVISGKVRARWAESRLASTAAE